MTSSNQPATASRLRDAMARAGVEILDGGQSTMAVSGEGGGWTETGKLDTLGHSLNALLVRQIDPEIDALLDRISALLSAGWSRVRVVTDHGWLLLPGGLPKVELSPHLVATKWSRCAAVKGGSTPNIPTYPWYWNPVLRIASPPGIGAFVANAEYAHGGISLQECVIPELIVERGQTAAAATITGISWRGMRCRVAVQTNTAGLQVDLRLNWKQAASSIAAAAKELGANGEASLAVSDDKHEGAAASEMRDDTAFMDRIHAYAPGWDYPKLNPHEHLTDHFGLVSDFLSECWSRLRTGNRVSVLQARVHFGGALSGRDLEAVNKTVSGLTKLIFPDPEMPVPDEDLEWIVRVALASRRRVKEQQRRVFKSEFRNTHFSYILGPDGPEQFVSTPELHSDEAIESDPLPPGQVWGASLGTGETGPGLYRIDVTCGPGGGVRILNQPTPPAFRESVRVGEQNLYTRSKELVGDRNPREEEFSIQMRPMDADKTGAGLGVPVLVALCGGLLGRNTRGGAIVVGALNLGGSIEMIPNAIWIAELAIDKQAQTLLMPVSARRQLNDLPDELWTKISIEFYKDGADAVFKALLE